MRALHPDVSPLHPLRIAARVEDVGDHDGVINDAGHDLERCRDMAPMPLAEVLQLFLVLATGRVCLQPNEFLLHLAPQRMQIGLGLVLGQVPQGAAETVVRLLKNDKFHARRPVFGFAG